MEAGLPRPAVLRGCLKESVRERKEVASGTAESRLGGAGLDQVPTVWWPSGAVGVSRWLFPPFPSSAQRARRGPTAVGALAFCFGKELVEH